jgi:hypothetical protein
MENEPPRPQGGGDEPDPRMMQFYNTAPSICNSVTFVNGRLTPPKDLDGKVWYHAEENQVNHIQGNTLIVCPKFMLAVAHLTGQRGHDADDAAKLRQLKTVFFTHWVNEHGVATLKMLLETTNFPYSEITGNVSAGQRTHAIQAYNNDALHVLILSKAGGEGINLMGTHENFPYVEASMEFTRNSTSENQATARAVRFRSHTHLPQNEQDVQVFSYLVSCLVIGTTQSWADVRNSHATLGTSLCGV